MTASASAHMNYIQARESMVNSQIHTQGVVSEQVLHAYRTVPRELFVPSEKKGICYTDEDLCVGDRYLLEPMIHSKMVEAANIKPNQVVLDVGGGTGYSAAILSHLAKTVVALESDAEALRHAEQAWGAVGITNLIGIYGDLANGCVKHAPYDVIFVNGAVAEIPEALVIQLAPNGVLICILHQQGKSGSAVMVNRTGNGKFSVRPLFGAATPYLKEFKPAESFRF